MALTNALMAEVGLLAGNRRRVALEKRVQHREIFTARFEIADGGRPVLRAQRDYKSFPGRTVPPDCKQVGMPDNMPPHQNANKFAV